MAAYNSSLFYDATWQISEIKNGALIQVYTLGHYFVLICYGSQVQCFNQPVHALFSYAM